MKKICIAAVVLLLATSCFTIKTIPLKGTYQETPIIIMSDNNKDVVWDKLIDFFAQKGLSIKIIDRSSGLITSEETQLTWTHEDKKGKVKWPQAWVAIPMKNMSGTIINPESVSGEWNVRIKATADNRTSINVNIVNIRRGDRYDKSISYTISAGRSTGIFEQIIASAIK